MTVEGNLFFSGKIILTPGAEKVLVSYGRQIKKNTIFIYMWKHLTGDWSEMSEEDQAKNRQAVRENDTVFSSYRLPTGQTIWIITDANREATTMMLPQEY